LRTKTTQDEDSSIHHPKTFGGDDAVGTGRNDTLAWPHFDNAGSPSVLPQCEKDNVVTATNASPRRTSGTGMREEWKCRSIPGTIMRGHQRMAVSV
jgi:hypothetical protein